MKNSILILTFFIYLTNGHKINIQDDENWARIPQANGSFRLISVEKAKLLYLKEVAGRTPIEIDFILYTKANPESGEIININDTEGLKKSGFNPKLQTRFIIHGWRNNYNSPVNQIIRKALFKSDNLNIFIVDWSSVADTINYYTARYSVEEVGIKIGHFLNFLHKNGGMSYVTLNLIGHSLGAHCAGYAGKYINKIGKRIHTIYGLDPAWPLFSYNIPTERLNEFDAEYVETIHTSGGILGFIEPIGKACFYPNWGTKQPGCGIDVTKQCAHERSYKLFAEAIQLNSFLTKKCKNYEKLLEQECEINVKKIKMGNPINHLKAKGIYFVPTNSEEPFGQA